MDKFAKAVRVATLPPIIALILVSLIFFLMPGAFDLTAYILALVFLAVLPVIGYPLQPILPHFKHKGREGQRNLAMIMALAGYIAGLIYALASGAAGIRLILFLTYIFSGAILMLFNKAFKIRASGHACGFVGPLVMIIWLFGSWAWLGLAAVPLLFWSCVRLKRHTVPQLFIGSGIPVLSLIIAVVICGAPF